MKRKTNRRSFNKWVLIPIAASLAILGCALCSILNGNDFWTFNVANCLTLLITVWLSFYIVQRNSAVKNQKEALIRLLAAIQSVATDEKSYIISENDDKKMLTMRKRKLSNYLSVLTEYGRNLCDKEDIQFVSDKFEEYDSIIGNHIEDVKHLSEAREDLQRPLDLIDTRIYEMIMKLYY